MAESDTTLSESPVKYMLTTIDNPFSPFTQFDEWYAYDTSMGYNSASFLDRMSFVSNDLSEADQAIAIQQAIDEIVTENVSGMWIKVSKDSTFDRSQIK